MIETMEECVRPLNKDDIDQLENQLGFKLPTDYRRFLIQYNGGRPIPNAFPIHGLVNNPHDLIHYFFGIDDPIESYNLIWGWEVMRGRMPDDLLPIACDHSSNLICLSLYGENEGSVVFWEFYDEHFPPTRKNVYHIADSFSEFIESIFEISNED